MRQKRAHARAERQEQAARLLAGLVRERLTREQIARRVGVTRRTLSRWQQQEPAFAARWRELAALEDARLRAEAERALTRRVRRMSEADLVRELRRAWRRRGTV